MTRLGELTRLDRLGAPVFHAIRPWSRALSVHQGKGLTREDAMVGALMEAVESHAAEMFDGNRTRQTWAQLPPDERALCVDDFGLSRGEELASALDWTALTRWRDGGQLWVPWLHVSLDLTLDLVRGLERSSNGLAASFCFEDSALAGFCELLERDAVAEWLAEPWFRRALDRLDTSIDAPAWLSELLERCRCCSVHMSLFGFSSLIGWPTAVCELEEPAAATLPRGLTFGSACRPTAAEAVKAAVLEAVQTRLTFIAAARDDLLPGPRRWSGVYFGFAPPLPPAISARTLQAFDEVALGAPATLSEATQRLEDLGFGPVASAVLPAPEPAIAVKVVAPGLAMAGRRRRSIA